MHSFVYLFICLFVYLSGFAHSARPGWRITACGWVVRGVIGLFFKNHWMQGHKAPMRPREAPTWFPGGPHEAPRCSLEPSRWHSWGLCILGASWWVKQSTSQITNGVFYTGFIVFFSCRQNVGLQRLNLKSVICWFYIGFISIFRLPWSPRRPQQDPQMAPRWSTWGPKVLPGTLQVTFVRLMYSLRLVVG